jgi:Flp pilus assembly protein TadD
MNDRLFAMSQTVFVASAFLAIGCSDKRRPEAQPQRDAIKRVDPAVPREDFAKAVATYRGAVSANPKDPQANRQLGSAFLQLGDLTQAYHFLLTAQAREPRNPDIAFDLGTFYLIRSNPDLAREKASEALNRDSANVGGLVLSGATALTADEVASARKRLEAASPHFGADALPRLALGNLYLRSGDTERADREFQDAVASEPQSAAAHSILQASYATRGNTASASQESKAFNDLVAGDSLARAKVAIVYLLLDRREDAKRVLREGLEERSTGSSSSRMLAELALADANAEEAAKALRQGSPADSSDVDALVLQGRYHLLLGETAEAIRTLRAAVRAGQNLAPVHFEVALADIQQANATESKPARDTILSDAVRQLETASRLVSGYPDAVFQLAALKTQLGVASDAISSLDRYARANPQSIKAKLVLGATLFGSGRTAEAAESFQDALKSWPDNAEAHYWLGSVLFHDGKVDEARKELEMAVRLSRPDYVEPITQLVLFHLARGHADSAFAVLTKQIDRAPQSARLANLLGLVNTARNDQAGAEAAFLRAIRLDPRLVDAHARLADLYRATGKLDQAASHAEQALRLNPRNVNALMASGAVHQERGDAASAHQEYVRALAIDPRNLGAANNLAVLLSDERAGLDSAFRFANLAHEIAPNDPHVSDTLGWILFRRGAVSEAAPYLRFSAAQLPDSPSIQYHLGMMAERMGDTTTARRALGKAVASSGSFAGKDEARRALAQLK